jgi:hypothetical protein
VENQQKELKIMVIEIGGCIVLSESNFISNPLPLGEDLTALLKRQGCLFHLRIDNTK